MSEEKKEENVIYEAESIIDNICPMKKEDKPSIDFATQITIWHKNTFNGINNLILDLDKQGIKHEIIKGNTTKTLDEKINELTATVNDLKGFLEKLNSSFDVMRRFAERGNEMIKLSLQPK